MNLQDNNNPLLKLLDIFSEPLKYIHPDVEVSELTLVELNKKLSADHHFSASVNVIGDSYISVILNANKPAVSYISKKLFGMEPEEIGGDEMYIEGVKEFLNIITGNSKIAMISKGINFDFALPEEISINNLPAVDLKDSLCRSFNFAGSSINLILTSN